MDPVDLLRSLPGVDVLLRQAGLGASATAAAREVLDEVRRELRAGRLEAVPDAGQLAAQVMARAASTQSSPYPRVVNATGVFLHTGLGRTPLSAAAARALADMADGFSQLEVAAANAERNQREDALLSDLSALTGAGSGLVVNNNAGALVLVLSALGAARAARPEHPPGALPEVIVSRGELVEIGGGFRIPEICQTGGVRLVEVGTTNRTYERDYRAAITPATALLLRVHTSNYRVVGFQHSPERTELVELAREQGVPVVEDIGSGLLRPHGSGVLSSEPDAATAVAEGMDLVMFSGDKLLGGPQAGVIVGSTEAVAVARAAPLFRALRPDRLTLAALGATLRVHRHAPDSIPVLAALGRSPEHHRNRARSLARRLRARFPDLGVEVVPSDGEVGSGAVPARAVPSAAVELRWPDLTPEELGRRLRVGTPSVFPRSRSGPVHLDVLALLEGDEERIEAALAAL